MTESEEAIVDSNQRKLLPVMIVMLIALAGAYFWKTTRGRNADHVRIEVSGCSKACSDTLKKRLGVVLEERGFVLADELATGDGHHITLQVSTDESRPSIDESRSSVRATVLLSSRTAKQVHPKHQITLMGDAATEDETLVDIGVRGIKALADDAVADIVATESIKHYLARDLDAPDLPRRDKIAKSRKELTRRKWEKKDWDDHCGETSADDASCLSTGCQEEYAIGLTPDGKTAYAQQETGAPIFAIGAQGDVRRAETPDEIVKVNVETGERETLYMCPDIYTYASMSSDGSAIAFIERISSMSGLIVLDTKTKATRVVYRVASPGRLAAPKLSTDGRFVSVVYRKTVGVKTRVLMFDLKGKSPEMSSPVRFGIGAEWLTTSDGERLAVIIGSTQSGKAANATKEEKPNVEKEEPVKPKKRKIFDDLEDAASRAELAPGLPPLAHAALYDPIHKRIEDRVSGRRHALSFLAGVSGENIVFLYSNEMGRCGVARFNRGTKEYVYGEEGDCVDKPVLFGDTVVASGFHANKNDPKKTDEEIISFGYESLTAVEVLTENGLRDRRPRRARDVNRVLFERKRTQRYFRHPRAAICILDIPMNPGVTPDVE